MPRVQQRTLTRARQSGVQLPQGAFASTAAGVNSVLGVIGQGANIVQKNFEEAQDLKNRTDIADKTRFIQDSQTEFQQSLQRDNIPPQEWHDRWGKRLVELQKGLELDSSETPPDVRNALTKTFEDFSKTSVLNISGAALKQNQRLAKDSFDRGFRHNSATGNHDANDALVEANRDLLGDDFADDTIRTIGLLRQNDEIEFSRKGDVTGHQKLLDSNHFGLSEKQLFEEQERTTRELKLQENEALSGIRDLQDAGLIQDEDELRSLLAEDPRINKEKALGIIENYKTNQPISRADHYRIQDAIDNNTSSFERGEITAAEYESEWLNIQGDVNAFGNRKGTGVFRSDLHNLRPSLFSDKAQDAKAQKERFAKLKPLQSKARSLIREVVSGQISIDFADRGENFGDVRKAEIKAQLDEDGFVLRSAIEDEVNNLINSSDTPPSISDIRQFIYQNTDDIQKRVDRERAKAEKSYRDGLIPPEAAAFTTAQKWLGGGSVLPAKGAIDANNAGAFTFALEGGKEVTGAGDKFGQVPEFFGMNEKADGANYKKVMATLEKDGEHAARNQAWNILSTNAAKDGFRSNNPTIQEILVGVHHHRGGAGSRRIFQEVTGTKLKGASLVKALEKASKETGFSEKWVAVREKHEDKNFGARPQFRKSLSTRWQKEAELLASQ